MAKLPNILAGSGSGSRPERAARLKAETEAARQTEAPPSPLDDAAEGATKHVVAPGETLASIAEQYGQEPAEIWDLPQNKSLREKRRSGNALLPGDVLYVAIEEYGTGPVGQGDYVVKDGDSIESIAFDKGYFWETLWNHPDNAELKEIRKDRNILLPGDRVTLPEKRPKEEPGVTEKRHRFVRRGVPAHIRLEIHKGGKPRTNQSYTLTIDDQTFEGTTDPNGVLEHPMPPNAKRGLLVIGPDQEEFEFRMGVLDPITEIKGVQKRLLNLGYACGKADGELSPETIQAIRAFQAKHELEETGKPDEGTCARLEEVHDQWK